MDFVIDKDLSQDVSLIAKKIGLDYIKVDNIVCFKSFGSKSRAIARIWALPRIWQMALDKEPHYCIEFIMEKYDRLSREEKEKVIVHELLHIPKNFSGSLLSHNHNGRKINRRFVDLIHSRMK